MTYILLIHILTSLITLFLSTYAWLRPSRILQSTLILLIIASLASGVFIHLDRGVITPLYCAKIGIYLLMVGATQVMLHYKLKRKALINLHIK